LKLKDLKLSKKSLVLTVALIMGLYAVFAPNEWLGLPSYSISVSLTGGTVNPYVSQWQCAPDPLHKDDPVKIQFVVGGTVNIIDVGISIDTLPYSWMSSPWLNTYDNTYPEMLAFTEVDDRVQGTGIYRQYSATTLGLGGVGGSFPYNAPAPSDTMGWTFKNFGPWEHTVRVKIKAADGTIYGPFEHKFTPVSVGDMWVKGAWNKPTDGSSYAIGTKIPIYICIVEVTDKPSKAEAFVDVNHNGAFESSELVSTLTFKEQNPSNPSDPFPGSWHWNYVGEWDTAGYVAGTYALQVKFTMPNGGLITMSLLATFGEPVPNPWVSPQRVGLLLFALVLAVLPYKGPLKKKFE